MKSIYRPLVLLTGLILAVSGYCQSLQLPAGNDWHTLSDFAFTTSGHSYQLNRYDIANFSPNGSTYGLNYGLNGFGGWDLSDGRGVYGLGIAATYLTKWNKADVYAGLGLDGIRYTADAAAIPSFQVTFRAGVRF